MTVGSAARRWPTSGFDPVTHFLCPICLRDPSGGGSLRERASGACEDASPRRLNVYSPRLSLSLNYSVPFVRYAHCHHIGTEGVLSTPAANSYQTEREGGKKKKSLSLFAARFLFSFYLPLLSAFFPFLLFLLHLPPHLSSHHPPSGRHLTRPLSLSVMHT